MVQFEAVIVDGLPLSREEDCIHELANSKWISL
jgi:hypothetical protein